MTARSAFGRDHDIQFTEDLEKRFDPLFPAPVRSRQRAAGQNGDDDPDENRFPKHHFLSFADKS